MASKDPDAISITDEFLQRILGELRGISSQLSAMSAHVMVNSGGETAGVLTSTEAVTIPLREPARGPGRPKKTKPVEDELI